MKRLEIAWVRDLLASTAALMLSFSFFAFSYASDPGFPDTIRFEPWGTYIPCPPCTGLAVVPLVVYNDEYLTGIQIVLRCSGPVSWDTAEFVGERASHMEAIGIVMFEDMVKLNGVSMTDSIPPGNGILAYVYLTVEDTGLASIDTTMVPGSLDFTYFTDLLALPVIPEVILKSEWHLSPQHSPPGDVDQSGAVNIVDVVFLINYLFRNGPEPAYLPCADPNVDCSVSLSDIVYLINYVFKSGATPQLGCAY